LHAERFNQHAYVAGGARCGRAAVLLFFFRLRLQRRQAQAMAESEIHEPINLGSSELVTINQLVDIVQG